MNLQFFTVSDMKCICTDTFSEINFLKNQLLRKLLMFFGEIVKIEFLEILNKI